MRTFINASSDELEDLRQRAIGKCIVFNNQEMPQGVYPPAARVGVEGYDDGSVCLLIDKSLTTPDTMPSLQDWFSEGSKRFNSAGELSTWLNSQLLPCYARSPTPNGAAAQTSAGAEPWVTIPSETGQSETTGVPQARQYAVEELSIRLKERIFGQDPAVDAIVAAVTRHANKRNPRRPLSLFLVGPTGVGKTETATRLANVMTELGQNSNAPWGSARLDMCEYREAHRVSQLFGAPAGYIGYGQATPLSSTLQSSPRSIILFDEIEKAHSSVFTSLINMMDAGRVGNPQARDGVFHSDCRSSVLLFSSNLGSQGLIEETHRQDGENDPVRTSEICRSHLQAHGIAPELLGRVSQFVLYQPLDHTAERMLVRSAIGELAAEYGATIDEVDATAIDQIAGQARLSGFGARPINYLVEDLVGELMSTAVTSNSDNQTGRLVYKDDGFKIEQP